MNRAIYQPTLHDWGSIDFDRLERAYRLLRWRWRERGIPDRSQLKESLEHRKRSVLETNSISVSSGGLGVTHEGRVFFDQRIEALYAAPDETTAKNLCHPSKAKTLVAVLTLFLVIPCHAQMAHYRHHGSIPLNDLTTTPGATDSADTKAVLCSAKFHTGTVRNVSEKTKHEVCEAYGLTPAECTGQKVEIDHLISLELGGSNDPKNLWPQPYKPLPGARQKDVLENTLHRMVCANTISLLDAQQCIAQDWVACVEKEKFSISLGDK